MKYIHKFLFACFSFVVNTFYNPNSAFGGWSVSIDTIYSTCPSDNTTCFSSASASDVVAILQNRADSYIKGDSACNDDYNCDLTACNNTQYVGTCTLNSIRNEENCLKPHLITYITCTDCPSGGEIDVPEPSEFFTIRSTVVLCSGDALTVTDQGELTFFPAGTSACRKYITSYHFVKNQSTRTNCHKVANTDYIDEKGTFQYTDKCYIDEE